MKKFLVATSLLALTCWSTIAMGADPTQMPLDYLSDQRQELPDENLLNAYHDEMVVFYQYSSGLRHDIWTKIHLFATLLATPETTKTEILALQQELQMLTNKLQREELSFRWDLDSQFPELTNDTYRGCLGAATGTRGPGR